MAAGAAEEELGARDPRHHLPPIYPPAFRPACLPARLSSVYLSVNLSFRLSCHLSPVSLCVRAAHGPHFLTPFKQKSEHIWASQGPSLSPEAGEVLLLSWNLHLAWRVEMPGFTELYSP